MRAAEPVRNRGFFVMYSDGVRALQKELNAVMGRDLGRSVLFRFGFRCGKTSAKELGLVGQGKKALVYLNEAWIEIGLARPVSIRERSGVVEVVLSNSLEASHDGTGCDFTRGFLGGMYSEITHVPHHCVERECVSFGGERCVFVIREAENGGK
ncbi:MAG: V4R domain-containing protein [Methanobacteriota archaeon]